MCDVVWWHSSRCLAVAVECVMVVVVVMMITHVVWEHAKCDELPHAGGGQGGAAEAQVQRTLWREAEDRQAGAGRDDKDALESGSLTAKVPRLDDPPRLTHSLTDCLPHRRHPLKTGTTLSHSSCRYTQELYKSWSQPLSPLGPSGFGPPPPSSLPGVSSSILWFCWGQNHSSWPDSRSSTRS